MGGGRWAADGRAGAILAWNATALRVCNSSFVDNAAPGLAGRFPGGPAVVRAPGNGSESFVPTGNGEALDLNCQTSTRRPAAPADTTSGQSVRRAVSQLVVSAAAGRSAAAGQTWVHLAHYDSTYDCSGKNNTEAAGCAAMVPQPSLAACQAYCARTVRRCCAARRLQPDARTKTHTASIDSNWDVR